MKEIIQKTDSLVKEIYDNGYEQFQNLKANIDNKVASSGNYILFNGIFLPKDLAKASILTEPSFFELSILESFFKIYLMAKDNLSNSISQIASRTLLEIFYAKILYFDILSEDDKRENAIQFWLCFHGLLSEKGQNVQKIMIYDLLLNKLKKQKNIDFFNEIKNMGFPDKEMSVKSGEIFSTPLSKTIENIVDQRKLTFQGKKFNFSVVQNMYRFLSELIHGNPVLINIMTSDNPKDHIFRTSHILLSTGLHIFTFLSEKNNLNNETRIKNLDDKIAAIIPEIYNLSRSR